MKHKPQLVVRWTCIEKTTAENSGSDDEGVVAI